MREGCAPRSRYNLKRILDTREADLLEPQPPLLMEGLETYAEGTASQVRWEVHSTFREPVLLPLLHNDHSRGPPAQLLYLQLGAAGIGSREADHAASHLGKAVGIATLLRGSGFHAQSRRSYLPLDLCAKHGVSQEDVYCGRVSEGMRDVVLRVASTAKGHLDEARSLQGKLPSLARRMMLSSLPCEAVLKALEANNFDPFDPQIGKGARVSPLWHVLRVKWHLLYGTF